MKKKMSKLQHGSKFGLNTLVFGLFLLDNLKFLLYYLNQSSYIIRVNKIFYNIEHHKW